MSDTNKATANNPAKPEAKADAKVVEKPLIMVMPTTKETAFDYIEDAASTLKKEPTSNKVMKLAFVRFVMDTANITDEKMRNQIGKQVMAMPSWFGSNASQYRQAKGIKSTLEEVGEEYGF